MNLTEYKIDTASVSDITNHLNECNSLFNPPLNSYVNIQNYAEKIHKNAVTFEAWKDNELIGLVACYLNNKGTLQGHITNVSITKEYQNKGIAKNLLLQTINQAKSENFKTLALEVNVDNKNAIQLYQNLGFYLTKRIKNKHSMLNRLNETKNIMVSICCITYNHENYIREAIEGFLMQKTDFPIEILIHDDASTDSTPDIIREYETKYPDIIKPIYQSENQYSKGISISPTYNWPRALGKYIAMCEGDDYWIDPYKLQKQVDFLEKNTNFSLTCHKYKIKKEAYIYANQNSFFRALKEYGKNDSEGISINNSINFKYWLTKTLTLVFRKSMFDAKLFQSYTIKKDIHLIYHLLEKGPGYLMNFYGGIYNYHYNGVWTSQKANSQVVTSVKVYKELLLKNPTSIPLKNMYLTDLKHYYRHTDQKPFSTFSKKALTDVFSLFSFNAKIKAIYLFFMGYTKNYISKAIKND